MKRRRRQLRSVRVELDQHELCSLICLLGAARAARVDVSDVAWRDLEGLSPRLHAALKRAAAGPGRGRDRQSNSPE